MKKKTFIGISIFPSGNWTFVSEILPREGAGHCPNLYTLASFLHMDLEDGGEVTFIPPKGYKPRHLARRDFVALNKQQLKELKRLYKKEYKDIPFPKIDIKLK